MIDAHAHLNFKAFEKDVDAVVKNAFENGVTKIINVGTKIDSSQKAVELTQKYENLYASVGIHPHHADKLDINWEEELTKLARQPKVVAIGECGLDFFSYQSNEIVNPKTQKEVFIKQIEIAHKLKLPLQIHNRQAGPPVGEAGKEILTILEGHKSYLLNPPGMFHCLSGDPAFLKKVLALGFYVGFDGNITYAGIAKGETVDLKELVKYAPLERLILETDSPYLAPEPLRGSRNEPKNVIIVGQFIASLKKISFEKVREATERNTDELFFPKSLQPLSD